MKRLSGFLFKNVGWKLISCVLALALWVLVMTIIDPISTKSIAVRLSLENKNQITDNDYIIMNESTLQNTTITVTATGRTSKLGELGADDVVSYVDLMPVDLTYESRLGAIQYVSVYTEITKTGFSEVQLTWNQRSVPLRLDKIVSVSFPVTLGHNEPESEDVLSTGAYCRPDTVTVTGPRNLVNTVGSVRVAVDLSDADDTVVTTAEPRVFDGNNTDITGSILNLSADEITITAPIFIRAEVPVTVGTDGELPVDYVLIEFGADVRLIELFGPRADVEALEQIELPPVNLNDRTESFETVYDVRDILSGTSFIIRDDGYAYVTVNTVIERLVTKTIEIPYESLIIIGADFEASVHDMTNNITVTIKGLRERIDPINADNIYASVDYNGLLEGEYELPVRLILPEGVTIDGPEPVMTIVLAGLELQEADEDG